MSLYVRVFTNFYTHRKTARLRSTIGDAAFWVPPRLWAYAAENQPDGDFSSYTAEEIAMLIGYLGDASELLEALHRAGFLLNGAIHDWHQHNGYHETFAARAKKAAQARWKGQEKDKKGQDKKGKERKGDKHCLAHASSMLEASNPKPLKTGPMRFTKPTLDELKLAIAKAGLPESEADKFLNYYEANGWRVGKNPMRSWPHCVGMWAANYRQWNPTAPAANHEQPGHGDFFAGTEHGDTPMRTIE